MRTVNVRERYRSLKSLSREVSESAVRRRTEAQIHICNRSLAPLIHRLPLPALGDCNRGRECTPCHLSVDGRTRQTRDGFDLAGWVGGGACAGGKLASTGNLVYLMKCGRVVLVRKSLMDLWQITRIPAENSPLSDLLAFAEEYPVISFAQEVVHRFLQELASGPGAVIDLAFDGERSLLAVVVDTCENADRSADFVVLGYRPTPAAETVLVRALEIAISIAAGGPQANLEVADEGLPAISELLREFGYREVYRILRCEAVAEDFWRAAQRVDPLRLVGCRWVDLSEDLVECYYSIVKMAFREALGVQIPVFEDFRRTSLAAPILPRLLLDGRKVVAFVAVRVDPGMPRIGEVHIIGRDPRYRGQRLGEQLLAQAAEILHRHGAERCRLEVIAVNPALVLYERFGFRIVKVVPVYQIPVGQASSASRGSFP